MRNVDEMTIEKTHPTLTFDHYKNDECVIQYKQTADLDSGSAHNEGPPKIQKPTQSIKLPENPLLRVLYNLHAPQITLTIFFLGISFYLTLNPINCYIKPFERKYFLVEPGMKN